MTVALFVLVVVGALLFRRWDVAVFAAVSPVLAIVLTEVVLKPIVGRYLTYEFAQIALPRSGAFPSGHETGLASLTTELAILTLRAPIAAAWRALVVSALALWTAVGAIGLVANLYHYATDTVGGVGVAVATVLGVALLVDAVSARFSSPAARSLPSTSRVA
jgi:undecaprenyl-diphosphatase